MPRSITKATAAATLALALASLACTGCSSDDASAGGSGSDGGIGSLLGGGASLEALTSKLLGEWTLDGLEGTRVSDLKLDGVRELPSITIEPDGRASGSAGVNRWFSSLDLSSLTGGKFGLGPAGSTMMAGPPEAMELENRFMAALNRVAKIDLNALLGEDTLSLLAEDGAELLRFIRPAAAGR